MYDDRAEDIAGHIEMLLIEMSACILQIPNFCYF